MVEIRRSGQLVAVAVIETFERKDGEWLNVWALAGEGMDAWIGDFVAWLQNAAQTWGLRGVMCGGRPGWEKALRALGWTKRSVVMEKQLCH